jgi:hypothetical protein
MIHFPVLVCFNIIPLSIISPFLPEMVPLLITVIESPLIWIMHEVPNDFPDHSA